MLYISFQKFRSVLDFHPFSLPMSSFPQHLEQLDDATPAPKHNLNIIVYGFVVLLVN